MERSGNFYKAIRLGYILISILIGCMVKMFGQGNIRRWREKGLVEPVSKRPGKIEYRVSDLRILQQRKQEKIPVFMPFSKKSGIPSVSGDTPNLL